MKYLLFLLIIINALLLRVYFITSIPPILSISIIGFRYLSMVSSLGSISIIFLYISNRYNYKIALLSAWVLSVVPWTIEQGRIASRENIASFFFLLGIYSLLCLRQKIKIFCIIFSVVFMLLIMMPNFWFLKTGTKFIGTQNLANNIFFLLSPEFFFFKNPSFWIGGVRESGIIYLSFLPFLFVGMLQKIIKKELLLVILSGLFLIIAVFNPSFPETRAFYFVMPFIALIMGKGLSKIKTRTSKIILLLAVLYVFIVVYDIGHFVHYYFYHYSQQVIESSRSLPYEPF